MKSRYSDRIKRIKKRVAITEESVRYKSNSKPKPVRNSKKSFLNESQKEENESDELLDRDMHIAIKVRFLLDRKYREISE